MSNKKSTKISTGSVARTVRWISGDVTIGSGSYHRPCKQFYYDDELFGQWEFANSSDKSEHKFYLTVSKNVYNATVIDGDAIQQIRLWKGEETWLDADEAVSIEPPCALYVVFLAVLREPEKFL